VELVHWFHQILQQSNSISPVSCARSTSTPGGLHRFHRSARQIAARGDFDFRLVAHIEDATERAWVWSTLKFGAAQIRSGHLLLAILKNPSLKNVLVSSSREFDRVQPDRLAEEFEKIVAGSPEGALAATDGSQLSQQGRPESRAGDAARATW